MFTPIVADRTVIPACDMRSFDVYKDLVDAIKDVDKINAVKLGVGFLARGLTEPTKVAHDSGKLVIYDHQKAGTDIHESSPDLFMDQMVEAGVDTVILFPEAGPVTQYEWTRAAKERNLGVIVGGEMTHPGYLEGGPIPEKYVDIFQRLGMAEVPKGYIRDAAPNTMYELAARMDVTDFVMPGNKPDEIKAYRGMLADRCGLEEISVFSPGLVTQGGEIKEGAKAAGKSFHAIVGRGIFYDKGEGRYRTKDEMKKAAEEHVSQI